MITEASFIVLVRRSFAFLTTAGYAACPPLSRDEGTRDSVLICRYHRETDVVDVELRIGLAILVFTGKLTLPDDPCVGPLHSRISVEDVVSRVGPPKGVVAPGTKTLAESFSKSYRRHQTLMSQNLELAVEYLAARTADILDSRVI